MEKENNPEIETKEENSVEKESKNISKEKKDDKYEEIYTLVDSSKSIIDSVEQQIKEEMDRLDKDIKNLGELEKSILNSTLKTSEELLKEIGYEEKLSDVDFDTPSFDYDKKDRPPVVKKPGRGKFSAFLLSLVGGAAVAGGVLFFVMKKLGIDYHTLPSKEQFIEMFRWIGEFIAPSKGNEYIGALVLGVVTLLVMFVIYKIKVILSVNKNLRFAQSLREEADMHKSKREQRKEEIQRTDEHVNQTRDILDTLNVLLDEYNAKLKRILHIEGAKNFNDYHEKSKKDIEDAYMIAKEVRLIIVTPEENGGELNPDSLEVLRESENLLNSMLQKLY